jgi:5-methylcytosine-specific restriction enzyme A
MKNQRSIDKIRSKSFYKFVNLRKAWLKSNPWCVFCLRDYKVYTPATILDHKKPHRGDDKLFLDVTNFQSLCKTCHDSKKQRQDNRGYSEEVDENGAYKDKRHPRYGF